MFIKKLALLSFLFLASNTYAHCPLCTIGAAAAAGGAKILGVHSAVVAMFIGAFALSIGFVIEKQIKKTYIPYQKHVILSTAFLTTVVPLIPLLGGDYFPFSIFFIGDYGSLLNTTHLMDFFLVGSIFGGFIVLVAPAISNKISQLRGNIHLPFQGLALTLLFLLIAGIALQAYL